MDKARGGCLASAAPDEIKIGSRDNDQERKEIVALYRLTLFQPAVNTRARYNVCPTTTVDTILDKDGKRRLNECGGILFRRGGQSRSKK